MIDRITHLFRGKKLQMQNQKEATTTISMGGRFEPFDLYGKCNKKRKTDYELFDLFDNSSILQQIIAFFVHATPSINPYIINNKTKEQQTTSAVTKAFEDITSSCYDYVLQTDITFTDLIDDLIKSYFYRGQALIMVHFEMGELKQIATVADYNIPQTNFEKDKYPTINLRNFAYAGRIITEVKKIEKSFYDDSSCYEIMINDTEYLRFYILNFNRSTLGAVQTPLYSVLKQIEIHQEQLETTLSIFKNRASPGLVGSPTDSFFNLITDPNMDKDMQEKLLQMYQNSKSIQGSSGAGSTWLYNLPLKMEQLDPVAKEIYDIKMVNKLAIEIASIFRVPAGILVPQRTYANASEDTKALGYAILNIIQRILNIFSKQVLEPIALTYGELNAEIYSITFDNTDITDIKDWESAYLRGLGDGGYITKNEVREKVGYNALPDGDSLTSNSTNNTNGSGY